MRSKAQPKPASAIRLQRPIRPRSDGARHKGEPFASPSSRRARLVQNEAAVVRPAEPDAREVQALWATVSSTISSSGTPSTSTFRLRRKLTFTASLDFPTCFAIERID